MTKMQSCLSREVLDQIGRDEILPNHLQFIEDHVSECEHCRELFATVTTEPDWTEEILPVLRERRGATRDTAEADQSCGNDSALSLLGATDDPRMLGRIGTYEVTGVIGHGGMGIVFKAFDAPLNRFVAIKMMLPHLATSGAARKRFSREGQAAAAVVDDHVLPIYGVNEWQGVPYLVSQYSSGTSLQKRIQDQAPLELKEILRIGLQAARGLAAAHAQGLVHRDVKPSNILLDATVERALLTDFGLARAVDDASLTRSGTITGTPQFMAPEQARGESVDQRSDLFSLGAVIYAMCTGHPPFRAETSYGMLLRITDDEPRPIRDINLDIPEWLCGIVARLMAKQPDDRFATASEVAELLEKCLAHLQRPATVPLPHPVITAKPAANRNRRPPMVKSIAAATFAFALLFAGVMIVLELNKGQLRIQCDTDEVPIRIMQDDQVVQRLTVTKSGKTVHIDAGQYVVEVDGEIDGITVENGVVSLKRRTTEIVKISKQDPDRRSLGLEFTMPLRLRRFQAQLRNAQLRLTQAENLYKRGHATQSEVEKLRLQVQTLEAEIQQNSQIDAQYRWTGTGADEQRESTAVHFGIRPEIAPADAGHNDVLSAPSPLDDINRELAGLNESVHHDFATDGTPRDRFAVQGADESEHVIAKRDGLHVTHPGTDGYSNSAVETQLRVHGSFDVIASFENLTFEPSDDGSGVISLTVILENDGHTHGSVQRGAMFDSLNPMWHFVQSEFLRSPQREPGLVWLGTTAEESTSGRLRLARVGETLYCLFAANDSPEFRLIHTEHVGPEDLLFGGIQLISGVQSNGNTHGITSVIWKDLTIRAERISDWPATDQAAP